MTLPAGKFCRFCEMDARNLAHERINALVASLKEAASHVRHIERIVLARDHAPEDVAAGLDEIATKLEEVETA